MEHFNKILIIFIVSMLALAFTEIVPSEFNNITSIRVFKNGQPEVIPISEIADTLANTISKNIRILTNKDSLTANDYTVIMDSNPLQIDSIFIPSNFNVPIGKEYLIIAPKDASGLLPLRLVGLTINTLINGFNTFSLTSPLESIKIKNINLNQSGTDREWVVISTSN